MRLSQPKVCHVGFSTSGASAPDSSQNKQNSYHLPTTALSVALAGSPLLHQSTGLVNARNDVIC